MAEVVDSDEVQKIIDGIYKGLTERFNPATRQLITAGKTYLKALHGAVSASTAYVETLDRISRQAQQGAWGGCADISTALLQCVDVYKDIQAQQVTVLKAFYVDLLVPLENSLEKDVKIIQTEHKKFLQDHKTLTDSYAKASAAVKKDKKRSRSSKTGATLDKELKHLRALDEEKLKLNAFCEQSMKAALTAERRRYGFVLERQCSLSKHWQALFGKGSTLLQHHLDPWFEIAKGRETLPEHLETMALQRQRTPIEALYSSPFNDLDDPNSIAAQLRKSRSMDVSVMDLAEATNPNLGGGNTMAMGAGTINGHSTMVRSAKSDFNLSMLCTSVEEDQRAMNGDETMNGGSPDAGSTGSGGAGRRDLVRAIYSYLASGDHQLSFVEGDVVCLIGEKNKGWQFGENLRTGRTGWFPLAYTEQMIGLEDGGLQPQLKMVQAGQQLGNNNVPQPGTSTFGREPAKPRPVTMFGDTLLYRLPGKPKLSYPRLPMGCEGLPPPPPPPMPAPGIIDGTPARPQQDQQQAYNLSPLNTSNASNNSHNNGLNLSSPSNSSSSGNSSGSGGMVNGGGGGGTLRRQQQGPYVQQQVYQQAAGVAVGFYGTAGKQLQGNVHPQGNASLHSSNDSGFHNDVHGAGGMGQHPHQQHQPPQAPPQPDADYSDEEPPRENIFATVKLRKTKTNDRSAPMLPTS